jgi:GDP-mannose 6-dehydrogenase
MFAIRGLGLGYVGMVNAVCLAQEGHEVYGIDVNPHKVRLVNKGRSPITEVQVESLLVEQRCAGRIQATEPLPKRTDRKNK